MQNVAFAFNSSGGSIPPLDDLIARFWILCCLLMSGAIAQAQSDLRISEFMAKNVSALADGNGQFNDWIEIWNPTPGPIDTAGYYLTDDRANPTKWSLPSRLLQSGQRLTVFCSGQATANYVDPAGNPHTNFRLADEGEYLALFAPNGSAMLSVFFPAYPPQLANVSFGLGTAPNHAPQDLIGNGASVKYRVPASSIAGWEQTGFSDTTWTTGNYSLGYDANASSSVAAFTLPANTAGNQSFGGSLGMDFDVTQAITVSELGCFDATGNGIASGTITVQLFTRNNNGTPAVPGDDIGVTVLASATFTIASGGTLNGAHRFKGITPITLNPGSYTIVASGYNASEPLYNANSSGNVPPVTTNGSSGVLTFIRSRYGSAGQWPATPDALVAQYGAGTFTYQPNASAAQTTDLGSAMRNVNPGIYIRSTFTPTPGANLAALTLSITSDDGYVAYLNGVEIARRNAPVSTPYNASAPQTSRITESVDVSAAVGSVVIGQPNVLAIHGMNVSANDADFFLNAQLTGERETSTLVYFTTPTPSTSNGAGLLSPQVVINEIHSDPVDSKTYPLEFIELFNPTASAVDLSGWSFSKGITFTFPPGSSIPAHGYVVIAENPNLVLSRFGVSALGPWTGGLANEGETIELLNAQAVVVDSVSYGLGFPWPIVGDDPGYSLQLLHEGLDNDLGGSWRAAAPTPGLRNSNATLSVPPQVRQVAHVPISPTSNSIVTVTAKVTDPDGLQSVSLEYQIVEPGNFLRLTDAAYATNWVTVSMNDGGIAGDITNGDSIYSAQIPASVQQHRRLIRYRIVAEDKTGQTLRVPLSTEPCPNFAYFVYDGVPQWTAAVHPGVSAASTLSTATMRKVRPWHLLSRAADVQNCQYDPAYNDGTYRFEGALVLGDRIYDHIHYRVKGQNSTYNTGKNKWKFKFNPGQSLEMPDDYGLSTTTVQTLNLSSVPSPWAPWNRGLAGLDEAIQFRLCNLVGVAAPRTSYAQLRVIDGATEQNAGDQYDGDFWGLYLAFENQDNAFKDEHDLPDGNIFRMQVSGDGNSLLGQGSGQPNDLSDLNAFISTSTGYRKGTVGNPASLQSESWWRTNVDLGLYYSWRAVNEAVNNTDIREQENVTYFRNPLSGQWHIQPWDCDLLYEQLDRWGPQGTQSTSAYEQIRRGLSHPAIATEFQNRARELQDLLLNNDQAGKLVDEFVSLISDESPRIIPNGDDIASGFVEADRRRWDYWPGNPLQPRATGKYGNYYQNPYPISNMGNGPPQPFYRTLSSADFAGQVKWVKDFIASDAHGGARLAQFVAGQLNPVTLAPTGTTTQIPNTPSLTYSGPANFPTNGLIFQSSAFSSPDGQTFAAMQWRIAECAWPGLTGFVPGQPWRYEIETTFESAELNTFNAQFVFPPASLKAGVTYRARVKVKDTAGNWSHWSTPMEFVTTAADVTPYRQFLAISEVMYKPATSSDYEFIELRNLSPALTLDLSPLKFTTGIDYPFPANATLAPGARALIVKNLASFQNRYGTSLPVLGEWGADSLNNSGETLTLSYGDNVTVHSFAYSPNSPWPDLSNLTGYSIVLKIPSNATAVPAHQVAANWRICSALHGNPGTTDSVALASAPIADMDGDELNALLEYGLGTSDNDPVQGLSSTKLSPAAGMPGSFDFTFDHATFADDVSWSIESATTLPNWMPANSTLVSRQIIGSVTRETRRIVAPPGATSIFARVKFTQQ